MGKLRQLSPELWPLIVVILFSYIELIFRGGVSCLPAALLFLSSRDNSIHTFVGHRGDAIQAVHFDELRIASAAHDNKIRIWDFNIPIQPEQRTTK